MRPTAAARVWTLGMTSTIALGTVPLLSLTVAASASQACASIAAGRAFAAGGHEALSLAAMSDWSASAQATVGVELGEERRLVGVGGADVVEDAVLLVEALEDVGDVAQPGVERRRIVARRVGVVPADLAW